MKLKIILALILLVAISISGYAGYSEAQSLRILTVPQGGTGASTLTSGECLVGNGTGAVTTQACSAGGSDFAWTDTSYGVSTSTIVGFTSGMMSMASSTFTGDVRIDANATTTGSQAILNDLYLSTSATYPRGFRYNSDAGVVELLPYDSGGAGDIGARQDLYLYSNMGITGTGSFEPVISMHDSGIINITNTTQGNAGSKYLNINMTDGVIITGNATTTGHLASLNGNSDQWNVGYTHSQDNTQAHTDYLLNNADDTTSGGLNMNSGTTTDQFQVGTKLGIATTTPWAQLSVEGQGTNPGFVVSDTANNTDFIVDKDGNVGIGTTTPKGLLDVSGTSARAFITDTKSGGEFFRMSVGTAGGGLAISDTGYLSFGNVSAYSPNASMGIQMVIASDGNAGIGTDTSPDYKFDVQGTLHADSTATFDSLVGIGTTVPGATLHVSGTYTPLFASATSGKVAIFQAGFEDGYGFTVATTTYFSNNVTIATNATTTGNFTANNTLFVKDGNVGIGTTTPYAKLSVVGEVVGANFTATTTATSTFPTLSITGKLYDSNGTPGANEYVLQSTGSGVQWVSTSTLAINPSASLFPIWAEENAALGTGAYEWAFGNGDDTVSGSGVIMAFAGNLVGLALDHSTAGSATVEVEKNGVLTGSQITTSSERNTYTTFSGVDIVSFVAGDVLNFKTITGTGSSNGNRVTAWLAPVDISIDLAAGTEGSVAFLDSLGNLTQDNANFFWDDSNNGLGIGTTAPGAMLHASSTSATDIAMILQGADSQTANLFENRNNAGTFLSGFTASGGLLMNIASTTALTVQDGSGNNIFVVDTTNGGTTVTGNATTTNHFTADDTLFVKDSKVGIGTDTPGYMLQVASVDTEAIVVGTVADYHLSLGYSNSGATNSYIANTYNNDAGRFDIRMKGVEATDAKLTVLGSGNIGISTTTPDYKLTVVGQIMASTTANQLLLVNDLTTNAFTEFSVDSSGDLSIDLNVANATTTFADNVVISGNLGGSSPLEVVTDLIVSANATTSRLTVTDLDGSGGDVKIDANGRFYIGSDAGAAGGISDINSSQLGQLSDVSTSTIAIADIIMWDGANWINQATTSFLMANELAGAETDPNVDSHAEIIAIIDNTATDVGTGVWTFAGVTLAANENITLGGQTLDHDGTDFVFNDSLSVTGNATSSGHIAGVEFIQNGVSLVDTYSPLAGSASIVTTGALTTGSTAAGFTVDLDASTLTCTNCIDISANTNLAVTAPIVLTDDTISIDKTAEYVWTGDHTFSVMRASTTLMTSATTTESLYVNDNRIWDFQEKCFTVASSTWAMDGTDIPLWAPNKPITVEEVYCWVDSATSVNVIVGDGTNAMDTQTCTTAGVTDSSLSSATFTAREKMQVDINTPVDTPDWVTYCINYRYN